MRGSVVGGDEHVEIAVVIEIAKRRAATDFGTSKIVAGLGCHIVESVAAAVQEKMRRLGVTGIGADVAHGVVDVAVDHGQVEQAVEFGVQKTAAASQAAL